MLKQEVLKYYGKGKCACVKCGFTDIRALSIDHINNNGAEHKKQIHKASLYKWLRDNKFPPGYQTLCMNCQFIKRYTALPIPTRLKSITARVRAWVNLAEQPFYTWQVYEGLGISGKQRNNVRVELGRLHKAGMITRLPKDNYNNHSKYKKDNHIPVSVFGHR